MRRIGVLPRIGVAALVLFALSVGQAYADSAPNWWEERSPEEQRTIVNSFFAGTGHAMPYADEAAAGQSAVSLLKDATPPSDVGSAATSQARAGIRARLLPPLNEWVPRLSRGGAVMVAAVGIQLEIDWGLRLYADWSANVDGSTGTGFDYTGASYYPVGHDIYYGARSRGEWILDASGWNPVRWFEPPCTFSGFVAPDGARLRTGVTTTGWCSYAVDEPPYYAASHIFVQYPYLTEADIVLQQFMEIGPWGSHPVDYQHGPVPAPGVSMAETDLVDALEEDGNDELRRGLLTAVIADRLQRNNTTPEGESQLDRATAITIGRRCLDQVAATPGLQSSDCGSSSLPMFVPGSADYMFATGHIAKALAYNASWVKLRYLGKGPNTGWYTNYPQTDTRVKSRDVV